MPERNRKSITNALLFILVVIAAGSVLRMTAGIFVPFVVALLLGFVLNPMVSYLRRVGLPRGIAVLAVLLLLIGFGALLGLLFYTSIQSLVRRFPVYQARFLEMLSELIEATNLPPAIVQEFNITGNLSSLIFSLSGNIAGFLGNLAMVIVFVLFILLEIPYMRAKMMSALQGPRTDQVARIVTAINVQIGRYLSVKILISTMTAFIIYVSFSIIGVDFPFIWAILTFLFNFVPTIGSIAITVTSGVFVILQFAPDWNPAVAAVVTMTVTQFLIGNILDPKMQGDSLNLSPVVILLSLLLWGFLWGIVGMFLAVPLTVAIKIVLENVPGMEWIGILMGTGNYREREKRAKAGDRSGRSSTASTENAGSKLPTGVR